MLCTYICLQLSSDNEVGVQQSANVAGGNACSRVAAVKIPGSLNEMSTTMQLNALNNAPQFPVQSLKYLLIITCFWSPAAHVFYHAETFFPQTPPPLTALCCWTCLWLVMTCRMPLTKPLWSLGMRPMNILFLDE